MGQVSKAASILVQLIGLLLSAFLVAVTYINPMQVEEQLQLFAIAEVQDAANVVWSDEGPLTEIGSHSERLGVLSHHFNFDAITIESKRRQIVPALLANALSDTCSEKCEFWRAASEITDSVMLERIAQLRVGQMTLQEFALERYAASVSGLLSDLRRFGLVNVVVFSLMFGLTIFRAQQNWRLTAFSTALTGYIAWAAYGYLYNQNWALTILLQDWTAPAYQVSMIFAACLFFDLLFLRGKITHTIIHIFGTIF